MSAAADVARRAIGASPALRSVVKSRQAQQVIATARAARFAQPAAVFGARQLGDQGRCARYTIDADTAVHVRHRTRDIEIMVEIFGPRPIYEPPVEVTPLLDGPLRVLDLGGNIGLFGAFALKRWEVTELRSYEPDPANLKLLHATAAAHPQWSVVEAAAGVQAGRLSFFTGRYSETRVAHAGEQGGVPVAVHDILAEPACDLLKMDIESGEWPILADPRLAGFARVIVVEWHALACPVPGQGAATAARLLADRGYSNQIEMPREHDGFGVIWAWR